MESSSQSLEAWLGSISVTSSILRPSLMVPSSPTSSLRFYARAFTSIPLLTISSSPSSVCSSLTLIAVVSLPWAPLWRRHSIWNDSRGCFISSISMALFSCLLSVHISSYIFAYNFIRDVFFFPIAVCRFLFVDCSFVFCFERNNGILPVFTAIVKQW